MEGVPLGIQAKHGFPPHWWQVLSPRRTALLWLAVVDQLTLVQYAPLAWQWRRAYASAGHLAQGVVYGDSDSMLDVYPASPTAHRAHDPCGQGCPVVVFVYGGAWSSGSRTMYVLG